MGKRRHTDTADEYMFLQKQVLKLVAKAQINEIPLKKAYKRSKKFIRRMLEIESWHEKMGYPHPEAVAKPRYEALMEQLERATKHEPNVAMMPDGTLPKTKTADMSFQTGGAFVNPDGTLPNVSELMERLTE